MLSRHVVANPRFAAGHPKTVLPDLEVEGGDIAFALVDGDDTVITIFTAQGAATAAEVILRSLHELGHRDVAREAVEQVYLASTGKSMATVEGIGPRNTITSAKLLPPEPLPEGMGRRSG